VNVIGAARWALVAGALCLAGENPAAAVALVSPSRLLHHHSQSAGACHCTGHRRCARTHAPRNATGKRSRCKTAKRSVPHTVSGAATSPTPSLTSPMPGAPAATPGTGSPPADPAAAVPPTEAPTTPPAPAHVEVTAEDSGAFRFALSRPTVAAGKVIIEFVNHGQDEHNLNAIEPTEGSIAGSIPNTAPNAHPSLTLNLRPGSYTLFCSIADHEAKGMKATLVVE
jgi:plastocyanin